MQNWLLLVVGIIAVPGGVCAQFNPIAATLTATTAVSRLFLITGALQRVAAFERPGKHTVVRTAAIGAFAIFIGSWILDDPVASTMPLTSTIGLVFLVEGGVKLVLAFATRDTHAFWVMLLLGAVSVLLGGMILAQFPASARTIPGIMLAIKLISTGESVVALALHVRDRTSED